MTFPGDRLMHGDSVQLDTDTASVTITGSITSQGILRDGNGLVELTLPPDADPHQHRDLKQAKWYRYALYRGSALLYSSPPLTPREITRRASDGALVVTGSP